MGRQRFSQHSPARNGIALLSAAVPLWLILCCVPLAQAQTYTILHSFTGGRDGAYPLAGLTMDRGGNLYGTASQGGRSSCQGGCGTVFEVAHRSTGWLFTPLYEFTGSADGAVPAARVTIGTNGTLYGSTYYGGSMPGFSGGGVVFNLKPPPRVGGVAYPPWTELVLYTFGNPPDGANPGGNLVFDAQGNLYGTTFGGGNDCNGTYYCGTVYELTPQPGAWAENILYAFTQPHVSTPRDGVLFDAQGRLVGSAGSGWGGIFRLDPMGPQWQEETLYAFQEGTPAGNVLLDASGNMFGATAYGGANRLGAIYELTTSGGTWTQTVLHSFAGPDGSQPKAGLTRDSAGNLYGTTCNGGANDAGVVFKLTPAGGGQWTETLLYEFDGTQGVCPIGVLTLDAAGNIYGTTQYGGSLGLGVVFELTP